jgi:hypothetical protein
MKNKQNEFEQIVEAGYQFTVNEFRDRTFKCRGGEPAGFNTVYNSRSKKFTTIPLFSKRLDNLSDNSKLMFSVAGNGSLETLV